MSIKPLDELFPYANFGTNEEWQCLSSDAFTLMKHDNGTWWIVTPREVLHEITALAAKLLLEQYDIETENLPES